MRRLFLIIRLLLFLVLPYSIANADSASNIRVDYSCPGKVTVTYDLTTSQPVDITLKYSPNKSKWLDADAVTGDITAQTSGTGKTIVWDCFADNVRTGGFYFKIELPSQPEPECVWINGVCWATRNVDEPGTFVKNPEDTGMFYQWNRKTAWAATGAVTGWDSTTPTGTTWEKANDPSPEGYRVPTLGEIQKLLDATKVASAWVTQNGVPGRKFTDIATGNSIFLPAVRYRLSYDGSLASGSVVGFYWSSTQNGSASAYDLYFHSNGNIGWTGNVRENGFSMRPVAEN